MADDQAQREMTLDEYMARLPESHAARRKLLKLRQALSRTARELRLLSAPPAPTPPAPRERLISMLQRCLPVDEQHGYCFCSGPDNPRLARHHDTCPEAILQRFSALLSSEPVRGWRPIATAPRRRDGLLLTDGKSVSQGGWLSSVDQGAEHEGQCGAPPSGWWSVDCIDPVYWMPMPEPPADAPPAPSCTPDERTLLDAIAAGTHRVVDQALYEQVQALVNRPSPAPEPPHEFVEKVRRLACWRTEDDLQALRTRLACIGAAAKEVPAQSPAPEPDAPSPPEEK